MTAVRVAGSLDRNLAWDGTRLYEDADFGVGRASLYELRGAAASVQLADDGSWRVLRDPLGINKLFWVAEPDGTLVFAARPRRLTDEGHALENIRAVPRGCVLDVSANGASPEQRTIRPVDTLAPVAVEHVAAEIRSLLDRYLAAVASAYPSARAYVCLSGGIDSSGIAALARGHFPNLVAVSFDLARSSGRSSDDRRVAERLARDLGMPLLEATVTSDELLEQLDLVLAEAIDWRDFNVHAGLVNAALARAIGDDIASSHGGRPVLVLTGDLANEFLADYHPERYRDSTYYELPRVEPAALRSSLVRGLDTCHREVGVFEAWGLSVVQPYAAAVDAYLALPAKFLGSDAYKQRVAEAVFGRRLPRYVYTRPKTRAQIGSANGDGGVLGVCVERGMGRTYLRRRFADLHGVANVAVLDRFIRAGAYRTAVPMVADE
jgi:asparagine synthetase B (glutamine-hydrolysing)